MNTAGEASEKNGKREEESDINRCWDGPVFDRLH